MNSNQIRCFLTVAALSSISKAADKLFVSQPAVSRQIASLEKEFGVSLFRHVGRNIELTECGGKIFRLMSDLTENLEHTLDEYRITSSQLKGTLQLGYISNWSFINLAGKITTIFGQKYSSIHIVFHPSGMQEIIQGLKWNDFDAVLTIESSLPDNVSISKYKIADIKTLILYSDKHPVAKRKTNPQPEDFKDSVFYCLSDTEAKGMAEHMKRYCKSHGFVPILQQETTWQTCLAHVYSGSGVIITDEWAPEVYSPQFHTVSLSEMHTIVLAWKKTNKNLCIPILKQELKHVFAL